jgi:hypothetical protein
MKEIEAVRDKAVYSDLDKLVTPITKKTNEVL